MINALRILLLLTCCTAQATDVVAYSNFAKRQGGIAAAWANGADGVEIDVRVSTDGTVYVFYDGLLETPGLDDRTYGEILETYTYDLPTLAALLRDAPHSGYFVFDLRIPDMERVGFAVAAIRLSQIPTEQIVLQSDDIDVLAAVRELWPEVTRSYASTTHGILPFVAPASPSELAGLLAANEIDRVSLKGRLLLDAEFIKTLKLKGLEVHVWTINFGARIEHYLQLDVDGIVTRRPGTVRKEIGRFIRASARPRTAIFPRARIVTTDPNLHYYRQIRESVLDPKSQSDTVFHAPQPSQVPVQVDCHEIERLGVIVDVVHTLPKSDYASELAWANRTGRALIQYYWTHSAYPDDDRIFYSRSRVYPRRQSFVTAGTMGLKQKHRLDGTIKVRITQDETDIYETTFNLVGCENDR